MDFDWREFLTLARVLRDNTPAGMTPEGACRCAISRAYYAAFGYARNYAQNYLEFQPRDDGDDHGRLRAHLRQRRRAKTATALDRLREWRNQCDYLDELPGDVTKTVDLPLQEAEYVFESLPPPASPQSGQSPTG
jgi:hypothetical protein